MSRAPTACENCVFFAVSFAPNAAIETPPGFGECRRNAPVGPWPYGSLETGDGIQRQVQTIQSAFPLTSTQDWCGAFIGFDGSGFENPDRGQS